MAKFRTGSKINSKRTRSVTASAAQTRQMVEERLGRPYRPTGIAFDATPGPAPEPKPDPAIQVQKNIAKRNGNKELPMSDDRKPIAIIPFITALRTSNATAERVCGFTHSVVEGRHILRENGEDGFPIEDWEKFRADDDYAQATVREFLRLRNEARLRNHVTREVVKPNKKNPVRNLSPLLHNGERGPIVRSDNRGVYHWRGTQEADRRSQAAPDWAPPAEQPKEQTGEAQETKTLDVTEAIAAKLAADMSQPEQLAAHKRVNWTGGVRDPYKPLQDDWIIAAHVIRFNQPFYTVEQMLVIYRLQAIGPKGPRYQDKMKDYSNDRFYIKPDELWHDEVTRTVAWIMEPESIDDQLTRWEWLDNRQRDKRAWACAQQQAAGLVEEMSNWEVAA